MAYRASATPTASPVQQLGAAQRTAGLHRLGQGGSGVVPGGRPGRIRVQVVRDHWAEQNRVIWRGIGVRIEDDVVCTAEGAVNLSAALPRQPDEVETWLAARRAAGPRLPI